MKLINKYGNLAYDSENEMCDVSFSCVAGIKYAFVTFIDIGMGHCKLKRPIKKRYWGPWDDYDSEGSMEWIMNYGGKWDQLIKQ